MNRPQQTVLLADEQKVTRKLLRAALERHGFEVLEAADGKRAQALARSYPGPIDLLLASATLAKLDGSALADSLQAEREGLRVVLLGTQPSSGRRAVEKPFPLAGLLSRIEAELHRKPPRSERPHGRERASNRR